MLAKEISKPELYAFEAILEHRSITLTSETQQLLEQAASKKLKTMLELLRQLTTADQGEQFDVNVIAKLPIASIDKLVVLHKDNLLTSDFCRQIASLPEQSSPELVEFKLALHSEGIFSGDLEDLAMTRIASSLYGYKDKHRLLRELKTHGIPITSKIVKAVLYVKHKISVEHVVKLITVVDTLGVDQLIDFIATKSNVHLALLSLFISNDNLKELQNKLKRVETIPQVLSSLMPPCSSLSGPQKELILYVKDIKPEDIETLRTLQITDEKQLVLRQILRNINCFTLPLNLVLLLVKGVIEYSYDEITGIFGGDLNITIAQLLTYPRKYLLKQAALTDSQITRILRAKADVPVFLKALDEGVLSAKLIKLKDAGFTGGEERFKWNLPLVLTPDISEISLADFDFEAIEFADKIVNRQDLSQTFLERLTPGNCESIRIIQTWFIEVHWGNLSTGYAALSIQGLRYILASIDKALKATPADPQPTSHRRFLTRLHDFLIRNQGSCINGAREFYIHFLTETLGLKSDNSADVLCHLALMAWKNLYYLSNFISGAGASNDALLFLQHEDDALVGLVPYTSARRMSFMGQSLVALLKDV